MATPAAAVQPDSDRRATRLRVFEMDAADARVLGAWCRSMPACPHNKPDDSYRRKVRARLDELPAALVREIASFRRQLGAAGVLQVRGTPLPEDLSPTPCRNDLSGRTGLEALLYAIGMLIGQIATFDRAHRGNRVQNIYLGPVRADSPLLARLEMHTEEPRARRPVDALALLCLRPGAAQPPASLFCDLGLVWEGLSRNDQAVLQQPLFRYPDDWGGPPDRGWHPIVTRQPAGLRFAYSDIWVGSTEPSVRALAGLREQIEVATFTAHLAPGDLVVIDNRHMIHGRGAQPAPRGNGNDRWLQRCDIRSRRPSAGAP